MLFQSVPYPWLFLSVAIIALFLQAKKTSFIFIFLSLVSALLTHHLSPIGLAGVLIGFIIAALTPKAESQKVRYLGYAVLVLWSVALFFHMIPGFHNLEVLHKVIAKPESTPFTMYLNLDKPMVFFAWFLAWPSLFGKPKPVNFKYITFILIPLFLLLPLADVIGKLKFDIGLPVWWWIFILNNLLLTCVAEETLFRGFLQQALTKKFGIVVALIIASMIFGLGHFSGGIAFVIFAALAGLGYGLIFYITGRLWAAVLVHFLFNFAQLAFFTYPLLAH